MASVKTRSLVRGNRKYIFPRASLNTMALRPMAE